MRRRSLLLLSLIIMPSLIFSPVLANSPHSALKPGGFYSGSGFFYEIVELINTKKGIGVPVLPMGLDFTAGDNVNSFGWATFGLTFDVDGTMYILQNIAAFDPGQVRSQLARVDTRTGEVTPIGDMVPFNTSGPDIDANGNLYVCGFQVNALGYIWGNSSLWRVNKATGEFTEVGDTGHTNWMDLAFDSTGTLWGTFDNDLYTIDPATGASTFVTEIHGVPDAGDPRRMEVMSIAFDKNDVLYATAMTVYYEDPNGGPILRIDTATGDAELLGYTEQPYNHGGDILLLDEDYQGDDAQ